MVSVGREPTSASRIPVPVNRNGVPSSLTRIGAQAISAGQAKGNLLSDQSAGETQ
jgi:hypothetical protein